MKINKKSEFNIYDFKFCKGVNSGCIIAYYKIKSSIYQLGIPIGETPLDYEGLYRGWRAPRFQDIEPIQKYYDILSVFLENQISKKDKTRLQALILLIDSLIDLSENSVFYSNSQNEILSFNNPVIKFSKHISNIEFGITGFHQEDSTLIECLNTDEIRKAAEYSLYSTYADLDKFYYQLIEYYENKETR